MSDAILRFELAPYPSDRLKSGFLAGVGYGWAKAA